MSDIQIDYAELAKVINLAMRGPIDSTAARIADHVRGQGIKVGDRDGGPRERDLPVTAKSGTTKRGWPVAMVTITHPAGQSVQAKHGSLTKAAASLGLTVKAKP